MKILEPLTWMKALRNGLAKRGIRRRDRRGRFLPDPTRSPEARRAARALLDALGGSR